VTGGHWPARLVLAALALLLPTVTVAADADRMVDQLESRGIRDERVLDAFRKVPREIFVPVHMRDRAYADSALDIGHGQTISQPYIVALMTELADVDPGDKVLEIGTGSGYQAAILSALASNVYTVEIVPQLAATARIRLTRAGYRNVHVKQGDGAQGWKSYAPYHAIIVTAVGKRVPPALIAQLEEGGVLVMPVGDPNGRQVLVRGVKRGTKLQTREITEVRFVPLTGEAAGARPARGAREQDEAARGRAEQRRREIDAELERDRQRQVEDAREPAGGPGDADAGGSARGSEPEERRDATEANEPAGDEWEIRRDDEADRDAERRRRLEDEQRERRDASEEAEQERARRAAEIEREIAERDRAADEQRRRDEERRQYEERWEADGVLEYGDEPPARRTPVPRPPAGDEPRQRWSDDVEGEIEEEELEDELNDESAPILEPESDARSLRDGRSRVARAPDARRSDRRFAAGGRSPAAARSRAAGTRSADRDRAARL
jgi:protein-L-isoaspartate(D-aspartate) O-methyltransferase